MKSILFFQNYNSIILLTYYGTRPFFAMFEKFEWEMTVFQTLKSIVSKLYNY
jgi:hypothetical protein